MVIYARGRQKAGMFGAYAGMYVFRHKTWK